MANITEVAAVSNGLVENQSLASNTLAASAITASSTIMATGAISASNFSGSSSGTNTGDQTITLSGDTSGSGTGAITVTLATVNSNTGSFGSSTAIPSFTVNGKGLITAASTNAVVAPAGTLTGTTLASNVLTSSLTSVGTLTGGAWNATTISIGYGGTGQTTQTAAFDALSPLTTAGDLIYFNGTNNVRLPVGSNAQVLTVSSGEPSWQTATTGANQTLSNLTSPTSVNQSLIPASAGSQVLGTSTDYWGPSYIDQLLGSEGNQSVNTFSRFLSDSAGTTQLTWSTSGVEINAAVLNMNNNKISSLATPSASSDAATKGYVDSAINGLTWKGPVQAYAISNVPLTGGATLTIDGYSVQNGDYVILSNQTTASQQNVYVASGIGTAYTLSLAPSSELTTAIGDAYLIEKGTVWANSAVQANAISPNNTYIQFAGPNFYTFSAPLALSGTTVSITQSGTSSNGYLSSTDWNTFNNKQPAGNYITALTGDVTASGPGSAAATLATVATAGTTGSSTAIPVITINAKGLTTSITTAAVVAPAGTLTGTTLASNVVSSSLTSVGTISTGTWQGTAVGAGYGGTGISTASSTGVPSISSGTWSVNTTLPTSLGGLGGNFASSSGALSISSGTVSAGTLSVANGGTGQSTALTAGGVIYGSSTTAMGSTSSGTSGNVLISGGAGAPSFSATPTLAGIINTSNVLNIEDSTDNTKVIAIKSNGMTTGKTLTLNATSTTTQQLNIPNITATDTLATLGLAQTFSGAITSSGGISITLATGTVLAATSQTFGTITLGGASGTGAITVGQSTGNQTVNIATGATASGSTKALNLGTAGVSGSTTNITIGSTAGTSTTTLNGTLSLANPLGTANGGTGTSSAGTQYGVVYYGTTTSMASTAAGTAGYLLTSNATSAPTYQQLNLGTSAAITGTLPVANGGTNNGSLAVTAGGVVYTDGTKLQNTGAGTSGYVLSSNGSGAPTWIANTPTFSGLTTDGIMYATSSSAITSTGAGSQYQPMVANGAGAPSFQALNLAQSAAVTGVLPVANGGTGSSVGPQSIVQSMVAGQSFSANTSYLVRMGIANDGGTYQNRVYAADNGQGSGNASTIQNFWVIGIASSPTAVSAGQSINVTMLGSYTLASSDTGFSSATNGEPVWLGQSGAMVVGTPNSTTGAACVKVGVVLTTGSGTSSSLLLNNVQLTGIN